ncbi:glycolate oxidase subunit GlcE [Shumkonia mesophila]|uniref:glycolate oxidase subunit GlcE n=1 Tax=Shumkonia mesophila TaxID=2838854 RepID=UPI0029343620|nr:glycolate oxidase subunit GlcE [Shumkonia mesophila]
MTETFKPRTPGEIEDALRWAVAGKRPLEVLGGGSKRGFGRPVEAAHGLDLSALAGIVNYEPNELVMSALPATPLADIEAALAPNRQQLLFEPADLGPLLGTAGGTIGGAIACNLAGPRRIRAGSARDHVLGFQAISGRGEAFKSGGRMFKNVTGFDLSKLMSGSFGTLAVLTEVTFKVLPAAETVRTVLVLGADSKAAVRAMTLALQSPNDVSGAAHLPADVASVSAVAAVAGAGGAVTALRVEGFGPSVDYRCRALTALLGEFGAIGDLKAADSEALWREIRDVRFFANEADAQVWRLSVPPAQGAQAAAKILAACPGRAYLDWGGGLVWLALPPRPDAAHATVRGALSGIDGHATLMRADAEVRRVVPVFQPQPGPLADLTARVKQSFDPERVLNPGRMYAGV